MQLTPEEKKMLRGERGLEELLPLLGPDVNGHRRVDGEPFGLAARWLAEVRLAAARPARAPNTSNSGREFEPSRFAPWRPVQAASPKA